MKNHYPNWRGWGVSVKGPMHKKHKIPNQDSWIFKIFHWGSVGVLSDGLGSHSCSHIGSKILCNAAVEASKIIFSNKSANIDDIDPYILFELINVIWLARIAPYLPEESSATCLVMVEKNDKILLAQLGDGLIVAISPDNSILLTEKNDFSNITTSIGRKFKKTNWRYKLLDSLHFESVIMFTDGISDDLVEDKIIDFSRSVSLNYSEYDSRKRYFEVSKWLRNWPTPNHTDDKSILCINKMINKKS